MILRFREFSRLQQASTVGLLLGILVLFYVTDADVGERISVTKTGLQLAFPIAAALLAWWLGATEAAARAQASEAVHGPDGDDGGLRLGAPPPERIPNKKTAWRNWSSTPQRVAYAMLMCSIFMLNLRPHGPRLLRVGVWLWWVGTATFVAFAIPRLLARRHRRSSSDPNTT